MCNIYIYELYLTLQKIFTFHDRIISSAFKGHRNLFPNFKKNLFNLREPFLKMSI